MNPSRKVLTKRLGREGKTWKVIDWSACILGVYPDLFNQLKATCSSRLQFYLHKLCDM